MRDMIRSSFVNFFYYSDVQLLSRGKIPSNVKSFRLEIHIFLTKKYHILSDKFNDDAWVAY